MPHTFWNGQPNERLTVHITLEPALSGERFFETMAGAASWQLVDNCTAVQSCRCSTSFAQAVSMNGKAQATYVTFRSCGLQ